ncbi:MULTISPECIES: hypothetical protein [unclassified Micromonospora]|uniref:hypothetical protein n=1 Tax=unclassified Micromonospora TaxID=2617518 RepID=UPI000A5B7CF2|nr:MULTISPECIES: hypothetical protein [unclassified Micromonospora]MCK1804957.1 hypothetical protein [Micromonospora sp. R42106]MCK1834155.1 hypothetical protein [Micromonospora sp. R42003]MCK1845420.1 hypothetical protein [Micromonospora sp. R42004]MCM1018876.1 hypothetical protein [Micromonospora sp. XM-20-01]
MTAPEAFRTQNPRGTSMARFWSVPKVLGDLFRDWRRVAERQGPQTPAADAYAAAVRTR